MIPRNSEPGNELCGARDERNPCWFKKDHGGRHSYEPMVGFGEEARHEMKRGYIDQLGRLESQIARLTSIVRQAASRDCWCAREGRTYPEKCVRCAALAYLNGND